MTAIASLPSIPSLPPTAPATSHHHPAATPAHAAQAESAQKKALGWVGEGAAREERQGTIEDAVLETNAG